MTPVILELRSCLSFDSAINKGITPVKQSREHKRSAKRDIAVNTPFKPHNEQNSPNAP
jgi:hypothetical protein